MGNQRRRKKIITICGWFGTPAINILFWELLITMGLLDGFLPLWYGYHMLSPPNGMYSKRTKYAELWKRMEQCMKKYSSSNIKAFSERSELLYVVIDFGYAKYSCHLMSFQVFSRFQDFLSRWIMLIISLKTSPCLRWFHWMPRDWEPLVDSTPKSEVICYLRMAPQFFRSPACDCNCKLTISRHPGHHKVFRIWILPNNVGARVVTSPNNWWPDVILIWWCSKCERLGLNPIFLGENKFLTHKGATSFTHPWCVKSLCDICNEVPSNQQSHLRALRG